MFIATYFVNFILFSFIGWIYECTYCTCKTKHWQNRGFLFGPICPIYGAGAVSAMALFSLAPKLSFTQTPAWQIFLICALGSAVLEYITSWVLEKFFHAVWWDYSRLPLNLHGRISLPTTCGFGLAGILIVRFLLPFVASFHQEQHPVLNEVLSLLFMLLLGADLALTVASLTRLLSRIEEAQKEFNDRVEAGVETVRERADMTRLRAALTRQEIADRLRDRRLTLRERQLISSISTFRQSRHRPLVLVVHEKLHSFWENLASPLDRAQLREPAEEPSEDNAKTPLE